MILFVLKKHRFFFIGALIFLSVSIHTIAQETVSDSLNAAPVLTPSENNNDTGLSNVDDIKPEFDFLSDQGDFNSEKLGSILFTSQERLAIFDSVNSRGLVRPVDPDEVYEEEEEEIVAKPSPEKRYIRLGGILYKSKGNWTIWLNGQRVTPKALPKEILDLSVSRDYVEMKWFDDYTKQILPIRLRANQRFHIDARMFLPG